LTAGSKTSNRIPSLSSIESSAAARASILCADVITNSDVSEASWAFRGHLEEKRRHEAKRFSSLGVDNVIKETHNSTPDWRTARSSSNRLNLSLVHNEDLGSKGCNVRESMAVAVEVSRWWELDSGV